MRLLLWLILAFNGNPDGGKEPTDRLVPAGFQGNPWGPVATAMRKSGELPPIPDTPAMTQWDQWGRKVLKSGDILFRRGDARILGGLFPFSRFIANVSGSQYSHIGTVVFEDGEPIVYDTTKASVRRQPLKIWILDNTGAFGVKRLKPEFQGRITKVVEYLHDVYKKQVPFDYELSTDDRELYCVEMAEKAFRHAGLVLSEPVLLADMENIEQFPLCVLGFTSLTSLKLDQAVFFPGNERHGIWSSPVLETIYPPAPTDRASKPAEPARKPAAAARPKSVADRTTKIPRN
ncbi:YiiX/YebB-like N1pC/P60 family cysteine hydrolase [Tundrisphaera lichenicola]|uniref:YiiX/YebB-like N1pC/P60 family cysteine hydrolase n=1 Tax=Tundrisphaera lichenicola TaxID=2029860 RepID=UPI003EB98721